MPPTSENKLINLYSHIYMETMTLVQKNPTAATERIALLDILRGFAVLGILLSNILLFSGYLFTPFNELRAFSSAEFNEILHDMGNIFISGKFYPLFCMLFGYGFYMQVAKFKGKEKSFVAYYSRRLFVLLLIGILHQLIWPGDVITTYALVGFLLLFTRNTNAKQDLYLSILFFLIYLSVGLFPFLFPSEITSIASVAKPTAYFSLPGLDNVVLIEKIRNEGISGMYYFYFPQYKFLWSFARLKLTTHSIIGLFFMGGYLYKSDFLRTAALKTRNVVLFFVLGALGMYLMHYVAYAFRIFDNLFLSLFYMSLLALIYKTASGAKFLQFLMPLGRMALTSYILQSVMCLFTFYGFGLGLFAQIPLYGVYLIAIAMLAVQTIFCKLWLNTYQFGPIEWIWRCLSYGKFIPIKTEEKQISVQN